MATYPALSLLLRLLGREQSLRALGAAHEPDPDELSDAQRRILRDLVSQRLETVAVELVSEAAASDDVTSRGTARAFVADRLAGLADLLAPEQLQDLEALIETATEDWGS